LNAIARVLDSGNLILGPELTGFECEFAQFVGGEQAVGVSSGTDALIVALRSLGIGTNDEVITVANGPAPTVAAIRAVGATPCFVDVDPVSLQVNPDLIAKAITPRTRCVVPLHLYGCPSPVDRILEICRNFGLYLIEDCAQAVGTRLGQLHVGMYGDIGCFSFYPTKNLGAFGDAGMCVTNSDALASRMREQRCYGFRNDRVAHVDGLNCRMDEVQAACLRVRLNYLQASLMGRSRNAEGYLQRLSSTGMRLPLIPQNGTHSWHQFVVRVLDRAGWTQWLNMHHVGFGIHYEHPVHLMPAYSQFAARSLPVTEMVCKQVLSLPIFPELGCPEVERVCDVIELGLRTGLS
jgi:dTDP-4-amino-4,6-dideoxygalactose transaminase